MKKLLKISYTAVAYLAGLGGLTMFVLFLGPWNILPRRIDALGGEPSAAAWLIDIGLVLSFGLQHSIMARPKFKEMLTRVVPEELERATYVLTSGVFMVAFSLLWQPVGGEIWRTEGLAANLLTLGWAAGFLVMVAASFMLDHFRLFGVKQLVQHLRGEEAAAPEMKQVLFYRFVRHPIQTGVLMVLWFAPVMTGTHLLLAVTMSIYVFIGLHFEERQLIRTLGPAYEAYRQRVGMVLPIPPLAPAEQPKEA